MSLPKHNPQCPINPPNQPGSKILLWIFLCVVIASFVAFVVVRPALRSNSIPNNNGPASPAKK